MFHRRQERFDHRTMPVFHGRTFHSLHFKAPVQLVTLCLHMAIQARWFIPFIM
jgi:hypothetical protein